jgi:Fic family protein
MLKPTYKIPALPPALELESVAILKALARANRALAELKGRAGTIPNQGILIDTLALQEAKASSEIENIVTTQDDIFQAELFPDNLQSPAAKEVALYRAALRLGFDQLRSQDGVLSNNLLINMFQLLKGRNDGFRNTPGTALKNERTGSLIYVPPQDANDIRLHMDRLEHFINDDDFCTLDPLIKMALIHHQFQSIHPFPDGNGRIGRILNVLYLTRTSLLEIPVLYLSRHITMTKADYYRLLQAVRDADVGQQQEAWESWILYVLDGVASTAGTTLKLVDGVREQMSDMKHRMRETLPKFYSQDLLNNLFRHPYTRIEFVMRDLAVTRQTAAKYLDALAENEFLAKRQAGRANYYVNTKLVRLFLELADDKTS